MEKSSVEVNLLGSSFAVQSDGDDRYLREVVHYLKSKVREIQTRYSEHKNHDPVKISLLAGLNVVDELFRCRSRQHPGPADGTQVTGAAPEAEIERITERLIQTIDRSLLGN